MGTFAQRSAWRNPELRPLVPEFRRLPDIWELVLGYWHLAAMIGIGGTWALVWDWQRRRVGSVADCATE
ncbi:MAG: hypothetical protein AAGC68_03685 [Verrucomicrobiota bacterium]